MRLIFRDTKTVKLPSRVLIFYIVESLDPLALIFFDIY